MSRQRKDPGNKADDSNIELITRNTTYGKGYVWYYVNIQLLKTYNYICTRNILPDIGW